MSDRQQPDPLLPEDEALREAERTIDEDEEVAGLLPRHRPADIEVPEADAIEQAIVEPLEDSGQEA